MNFNILNQWGKPQKGEKPNFEISVEGSKRRKNTIFDSNLVGGNLGETMRMILHDEEFQEKFKTISKILRFSGKRS